MEETIKKIEVNKVIIRNSTFEDIEKLAELSKVGFPGMDPFEPKHFESHLNIFPEGQFCIEYENKIIGSSSSMILNFADYSVEDDFDRVTSDGFITNHNPSGINLYGVDIVIHPKYRGMGLGSKLYDIRRKLCRDYNLKSIVFGGRIPNYHEYSDVMNVEHYVNAVIKEKIHDATLTFQLRQGFKFKGVIKNYLPDDSPSLKYATLLEWKNLHN